LVLPKIKTLPKEFTDAISFIESMSIGNCLHQLNFSTASGDEEISVLQIYVPFKHAIIGVCMDNDDFTTSCVINWLKNNTNPNNWVTVAPNVKKIPSNMHFVIVDFDTPKDFLVTIKAKTNTKIILVTSDNVPLATPYDQILDLNSLNLLEKLL